MQQQQKEIIDAYWRGFLQQTGRPADLRYCDCYHFDNSEKWANKLLQLVLAGQKRATSSSAHFFTAHQLPLPEVSDCSVITDWAGTPRCIVETTAVTILPFRDITFDICRREGEDDDLESWRQGHIRFFTEDGRAEGYTFSWDMPVVSEDFKVVYQ